MQQSQKKDTKKTLDQSTPHIYSRPIYLPRSIIGAWDLARNWIVLESCRNGVRASSMCMCVQVVLLPTRHTRFLSGNCVEKIRRDARLLANSARRGRSESRKCCRNYSTHSLTLSLSLESNIYANFRTRSFGIVLAWTKLRVQPIRLALRFIFFSAVIHSIV